MQERCFAPDLRRCIDLRRIVKDRPPDSRVDDRSVLPIEVGERSGKHHQDYGESEESRTKQ